MKKRMLSFALALLLCAGLTAPAFAAEDDFEMRGTVLSHYNGPGGDVVIPDGVTEIDDEAFKNKASITSVTIPAGVTKIGYSVFEGCTGLTAIHVAWDNEEYLSIDGVLFNHDVTQLIRYPAGKAGAYVIPDCVTDVVGAFRDCAGLTSITIPNGVTDIRGTFSGCTSLTSVTIPNGVTEIGGDAFEGCTSLTSVIIPVSVTKIGNSAFASCKSLTSVTIPYRVTEIDAWAFAGCDNLKEVTIPKGCNAHTTAFSDTPYRTQKDIRRNIMIGVAAAAVILVVALFILKKKGILSKKNVTAAAAKVSETTAKAKKAVKLVGGITCSCGTVNPPDAKFCAACGKPVVVPGRCPACGHQNDPAAKFCQGCGKPLDGDDAYET